MQEQQCFSLCLSCSIRKGWWKDSILQHNLCYYIDIKRNMTPEGLQASTAKWQVLVKVNVSFSFQSSINSRLPIISSTAEQRTSVYRTWAFSAYLIYLLIIQEDREISFPFIDSFEDFRSIPVEARKEKAPQGCTWDWNTGCFYQSNGTDHFIAEEVSQGHIWFYRSVSLSLAQGFWSYLSSTSTVSHGVLQLAERMGEFVVCPHSTLAGTFWLTGLRLLCHPHFQLSIIWGVKRNQLRIIILAS